MESGLGVCGKFGFNLDWCQLLGECCAVDFDSRAFEGAKRDTI